MPGRLQDQSSVTRSPGADAGKAAPAVCGASVSSAGLASAWSVPRPLGMGCLAPRWGGGALASAAPAALRAEPSLLQMPLPWERLETSGTSAQKLVWGRAHPLLGTLQTPAMPVLWPSGQLLGWAWLWHMETRQAGLGSEMPAGPTSANPSAPSGPGPSCSHGLGALTGPGLPVPRV